MYTIGKVARVALIVLAALLVLALIGVVFGVVVRAFIGASAGAVRDLREFADATPTPDPTEEAAEESEVITSTGGMTSLTVEMARAIPIQGNGDPSDQEAPHCGYEVVDQAGNPIEVNLFADDVRANNSGIEVGDGWVEWNLTALGMYMRGLHDVDPNSLWFVGDATSVRLLNADDEIVWEGSAQGNTFAGRLTDYHKIQVRQGMFALVSEQSLDGWTYLRVAHLACRGKDRPVQWASPMPSGSWWEFHDHTDIND